MKRPIQTSIASVALVLALWATGGQPCHADPSAARGEKQFKAVCTLCHGQDGGGLEQLGLNLRSSTFVKSSTDEQLVKFLEVGREGRKRLARASNGKLVEPTCGFNMPPKGGDFDLTTSDLANIVSYLRTINHP